MLPTTLVRCTEMPFKACLHYSQGMAAAHADIPELPKIYSSDCILSRVLQGVTLLGV